MPRPEIPDRLIGEAEEIHQKDKGYQPKSFQEALATVIDLAEQQTENDEA